MNKTLTGVGIFAGLTLVVVLLLASKWMGVRGEHNRNVNAAAAQQQTMNIVYQNTWTTISQKGQVVSKYKDDFKDVFVNIMNARYQTGGDQFKAVQEATGQNLDSALYRELMQTIEAKRDVFTDAESKAIAIKQQDDNLLGDPHNFLFVSGLKPIELKLVTSDKTTSAFTNGENESDVKVF